MERSRKTESEVESSRGVDAATIVVIRQAARSRLLLCDRRSSLRSELSSLKSRPTAGEICGEEEERGAGRADGGIAILSSGKSSSSWKAEAGAIHVDAGDDSGRLVSTTSTALLSPLGWESSCIMGSLVECLHFASGAQNRARQG
jgi:hypothetical protein